MYYYQHHIGDFDAATRHLTRLERSIYRDLIELYYKTETALPLDLEFLGRKIDARRAEESTAMVAILQEFFHETPTGWFHDRCEEEIDKFRKFMSNASAAGRASAAARAERRQAAMMPIIPTTVEPTLNGGSTEGQPESNGVATNQQPTTNNQQPNKKHKAPAAADAVLFPGVDSQVIADFKALRKQKRAAVTTTAMQNITTEATKAGLSLEDALRVCCARGWQGFKAEWLESKAGKVNGRHSINSMGGGYGDDPADPFHGLKRS